MSARIAEAPELCVVCVYFPPNLPIQAYSREDWDLLQSRPCSFEHEPGDVACLTTRSTYCAVVAKYSSA